MVFFLTAFLLQILCFTLKNRSSPTGNDFAKTTKFQDLGKQRKCSPCLLKIEISTNYPANLKSHQIPDFQPKCFFEHKIQRVHATRLGSNRSCLQHTQNCIPNVYQVNQNYSSLFGTKSNLQIVNHIRKQNSNSKQLKILQNFQISITKPQASQDLKHLTPKIV